MTIVKRILYLLIMSSILTTTSYAKNRAQDWNILHNGLGSIIEVYDHEKKSKVIEFSSHSNKDTYIKGAKKGKKAWNNRKSKTIRWSFKYKQNYVAIVTLATIKGYRNLIYTANDKDFKSYIGLGSHTIKGEWITITRNLEEDLRQQDPTNKIVAVNGFAIRGDGKIADVHMLKVIKRSIVRSLYRTIQEALTYIRNRKFLTESIAPKEVEPKHIPSNKDNTSVPTVTLLNGKKIYLDVGKEFVEPGVIATDSNGDPLDVEVIGDVNTSQVDTYPLHYLAIDKNGNATSVTRLIIIISKDIKKIKIKKSKSANSKEDIKQDTNNSKSEEEIIEEEELEEMYNREMEKEDKEVNSEEIDAENTEIQTEIDDIFANAEGETHEEKLENIATRLEELMDSSE